MSRVRRAVQPETTTAPAPTSDALPAKPFESHPLPLLTRNAVNGRVCASCTHRVLETDNVQGKLIGVASASWSCPKCGAENIVKAPIDYPGEVQVGLPPGTVKGAFDVEPDVVTVAWGEEKFFPDPSDRYSSFVAGMVIVKTPVRPGETVVQAGERAYAAAKQIGEKNRRDKWQEYMSVLREIRTGVKGS